MEFIRNMFSADGFMPHGHCYLWDKTLVWTMVTSDTLIGFAYVAISLSLYALVRKIKLPFSSMFLAFGLFIGACGATHFMEVLTLWHPYYWLAALVKVTTAVASVATAALMAPTASKIVKIAEQQAGLRKAQEDFQAKLRAAHDQLEVRVKERTQQFEELINTIEGIVWETPIGQSPYTLVSRQAETLFGYPVERWLSEPRFWQGILHPDDRQRLAQAYTGLVPATGDRHLEYRAIAADGRVVWIKDFIRVIYENGQPAKLRGLMVDITDRKRVEADLVEVRESALRAASVKADFLANMSHEIRTPLNAVIGMATLALDTRLNKLQRDCVETIKRSGDSLLTLINDILDFSKIEAGKLTLEVMDFNLRTLLRDSTELVYMGAKKNNLKLSTHLDPDIPASLSGDSGRLLQILINLMSNAVKFTESGQVAVSVAKEAATAKGIMLRFEVRDTGVGMSRATLEKLFHPFTQGDNSTARKFGGTGLGLSICKRLIDLMNGEIGATSEEGRGSVFWFRVPLAYARGPMLANAAPINKIQPRNRSRKRILIAEDNVANQKVVLRFLEKLGYRADAVANGLEAVLAVQQKAYDLILMDCQMPEMDGYEACVKIRHFENITQRARIPILALTAHALSGDREKCLAAGMDDYLSKPVELDSLDEAVNKWTTPAAPKKPSTLDHDYLAQLQNLRTEGQPDLIDEVSEIFLRTAPERIGKIRQAFASGDSELLARESHGLRSTCASVGARPMGTVCETLEKLARQGGSRRAKADLVQSLDLECKKVSEELRTIRKQAAAG